MRKRGELYLLRPWYDDLNCRSIIGTWLGITTLVVLFTWSWSIFVVICLVAIWTDVAAAYWKFVRRWGNKTGDRSDQCHNYTPLGHREELAETV